jgi:hypothetical protein
MVYAKQSTAIIVTVGPVLDADGVAVTGGVVADFKASKNGAAPAALNGSATLTHRSVGFYSLSLTTSDTDTVGTLEIVIDDTTNACPMKDIQVLETTIYDALFADGANAFSGAAGATTLTALASGSITAAVIATGAIDADAIADNAIDAWALAADCITAAKIADGAIDANTFAAGAITASAIAADAIGASELAADAVTEIANAVWDTDATGRQTQGTFGQAIGDPAADANTIYGAVVTGAAGATIAADIVAVKAETADILADTAEIGAAGAGLTNINLPNQTMDIVGNITGNLSGSVGSVTGAVGSVTGAVGSVTGAVGSVTAVSSGAITEASFATTAGTFHPLNVVDQGTAQSATGTTLVLRAAAGFADSELVGARILITGGDAGVGQSRLVTAYVSATDTATVSAWTTTPSGTITYKVFGDTAAAGGSAPTAAEVAAAVWDEAQAGHVAAGSFGELATEIASILDDTGTAGVVVASLAAGSITAAAIATGAIDADALAADAGTEIGTAVWATATRTLTSLSGLTVDTVTTLTNLPAITANWLTAAGTAADFTTEIQSGLATAAELAKVPKSDSNVTWNATALASIQTEAEDALVTHRLDELLNADSDIDGAAPPTVGSVFHELMSKTAGSFTFDQTTDALEALRDRGDAAWTTATGFSTHSAADVWSAVTRTLTAGTNIQLPSNGLANVTAWTVAITGNVTGNLSGSVGSVTGAINTAAGVITTLDGLDTAQDTQHATTQTAVADVPTNAELATALDALPTAAENATAVLTTAMTESYSADGATATLAQAVYLIMQMLMEKSVSSTTLTVKRLDGSTTAATFTLNSATTPTSITRAT